MSNGLFNEMWGQEREELEESGINNLAICGIDDKK